MGKPTQETLLDRLLNAEIRRQTAKQRRMTPGQHLEDWKGWTLTKKAPKPDPEGK